METLADAYLRAVAYVRDTPGGYGAGLVLLERTLAEWHTVFSRANVQKLFAAFDDGLAEARARYAAAPADSRDAEPSHRACARCHQRGQSPVVPIGRGDTASGASAEL
jgi:cytochrome c553